ncbi:CPBP family intramembrane glutamic endopeptidase [Kallotenue papyrolyticum]|uniref:CPBP family intramembrane glutamic endopeptidase n=1 Tax=Kallotenue papyrolyticum TaxID=1325125 RepID=UPI0004923DEB|nr:CPBP family intramembrane glutamic endopeptidase [Kallotenue papyrolyticum]
MYSSTSTTTTLEPAGRTLNRPLLLGALIVLLALSGLGFWLGGELGQFMLAGLQIWPLIVLAVLAYLGVERLWARILALLWLTGIVAAVALTSLGLTTAVLAPELVNASPTGAPVDLRQALTPEDTLRLLLTMALLGASLLPGLVLLVPAVRRGLARLIPINPDSFVHTIALVAVVTLMPLCCVPLLVLGEPPLLALLRGGGAEALTGGQDDAALLRSTIYVLVWQVPGAILAVGYGVRRHLGEALRRLGFVRPTLRQVLIGIGAAVALVVLVTLLSAGIDRLWQSMGWPRTDEQAFEQLLAFAFSPLGAVVIGVTAGVGEELAIRGVLQPRLGILLSNLFFTVLHAWQYNWDALLVVFLIGLALGWLRKRTNTTTSAIAHGTYDFILIMLTVLQIPGMSE